MLPYTQVHQESSDKLELKQTVHTNSLSGFAVIAARKRLEVKENPLCYSLIQNYSKRLGSLLFTHTYFPVIVTFH